jgi:hypothetical protein
MADERLGANKLHPLEIPDARQAAHSASEKQRDCENRIRQAARALAEAERAYRELLSTRMLALHAGEGERPGLAITTCADVARGEPAVARKRYERDIQKGVLEAAQQEAFRRGADRRDIHVLLTWSQHRDLRTDTPPPGFLPGEAPPETKGTR